MALMVVISLIGEKLDIKFKGLEIDLSMFKVNYDFIEGSLKIGILLPCVLYKKIKKWKSIILIRQISLK